MSIPNSNTTYKRSSSQQRLAFHLHAAGRRPALIVALIAVESGQPRDRLLEDFARLHLALYRTVGADPLEEPMLIARGAS